MSIRIKAPRQRIAQFSRQNHIRTPAFFGSVLSTHFGPDSDVDLLVEFQEDHEPSLIGCAALENELSRILGRKTELEQRKAVEHSETHVRRRHVLQPLEGGYVAQ